MALASPPAGHLPGDPLLVGELAALTELLVINAGQDHGFQQGLHSLRVEVQDSGLFVVHSPAPEASSSEDGDREYLNIDIEAYHRALRDTQIARAAQAPADDVETQVESTAEQSPFKSMGRVPNQYHPLRDALEPSLQTVDDHLAAFWGTGLDGIAAVLGVATDWPTDADGIAEAEPDQLVAEAIAWSQRPESEIRAALDLLTLAPEHLAHPGDRTYLEVERRADRLALRPLPMVRGRIWILPWLIGASQQLYGGYLASARLPHPARSLPAQATDAMTEHRKASNVELEEQVRSVVTALGLAHRFRFTQGELKKAGILNPVGEIDLLIADPASQRLWVCEIKDPVAAFSAATVRAHARKFLWRDGYVANLLAKADQIREHSNAAARACGVNESGSWRVIPIMLTRRVEPAAYSGNPGVAFLLPHQLATLLKHPQDPNPGPVPPRGQ